MNSSAVQKFKSGVYSYLYFLTHLAYYIKIGTSDVQLLEILEYFYSIGMDINLMNPDNMNGFHICACIGNIVLTKWYLSHGADPNVWSKNVPWYLHLHYIRIESPLNHIIRTRDIDLLKMALDAGIHVRDSPISRVFRNIDCDTYDYILRQLNLLLDYGATVSKEELTRFMELYNGYNPDDDYFYSCIEDEYDDIIEEFATDTAIKMVNRYLHGVPSYAARRIQKATRNMLKKIHIKKNIAAQCIQSYIRKVVYHPDYIWKDGKTTIEKFKPNYW